MASQSAQSSSTNSALNELTCNDLALLCNTLNPVAPKCFELGLQLGLKESRIQKIRANNRNEDQLREIISERLKQESLLTWHDIITPLRSPSVHHPDLARHIESLYISPSSNSQQGNNKTLQGAAHASVYHTMQAPAQYPTTHPPPLPASSIGTGQPLQPLNAHYSMQTPNQPVFIPTAPAHTPLIPPSSADSMVTVRPLQSQLPKQFPPQFLQPVNTGMCNSSPSHPSFQSYPHYQPSLHHSQIHSHIPPQYHPSMYLSTQPFFAPQFLRIPPPPIYQSLSSDQSKSQSSLQYIQPSSASNMIPPHTIPPVQPQTGWGTPYRHSFQQISTYQTAHPNIPYTTTPHILFPTTRPLQEGVEGGQWDSQSYMSHHSQPIYQAAHPNTPYSTTPHMLPPTTRPLQEGVGGDQAAYPYPTTPHILPPTAGPLQEGVGGNSQSCMSHHSQPQTRPNQSQKRSSVEPCPPARKPYLQSNHGLPHTDVSHSTKRTDLKSPSSTSIASASTSDTHPVKYTSYLDVVNQHSDVLTETISGDLTFFINKFIELGFVTRTASDDIVSQHGVGNREKAGKLLSLLTAHYTRMHNKKEGFDKFVSVFSSETAYKDVADVMKTVLEKMRWSDLGSSVTKPLTQTMASHIQSSGTQSQRQSGRCLGVSAPPTKSPDYEPKIHHVRSNTDLQSTYHQSQTLSSGSGCLPAKTTGVKSPMDLYIDYVKDTYRQSVIEKDPSVLKWPPTPSQVFINLAYIDRTTDFKKEEADEYTRAMIEDGNIDVILNKKTNIDFSDIAQDLPPTGS